MRFLLALVVAFTIVNICTSCDLDVAKIGCYKDKEYPPMLAWNIYSPISKDETDEIFHCECARRAQKEGCTYFGITDDKKCMCSTIAALDYNKYEKCPKDQVENDGSLKLHLYEFTNCVVDDFIPMGCYKDLKFNRDLSDYTLNWRDDSNSNWDGIVLDWYRWSEYLYRLVCRCASAAKSKGHSLFGIQFYGECWSGKEDSDFTKNGKSNECIGYNFKPCGKDKYCAGKEWANFVYKLDLPTSTEVADSRETYHDERRGDSFKRRRESFVRHDNGRLSFRQDSITPRRKSFVSRHYVKPAFPSYEDWSENRRTQDSIKRNRESIAHNDNGRLTTFRQDSFKPLRKPAAPHDNNRMLSSRQDSFKPLRKPSAHLLHYKDKKTTFQRFEDWSKNRRSRK